MKAVLIANGKMPEKGRLNGLDLKGAKIICADGGYDNALMCGLVPDVVIGDMDSVKAEDIKAEKIIYPARKDCTDSELIMEYARDNGYTDLILLGFTGTRTDHTLTNLSLLWSYRELNAVIIDNNNEIRLIKSDNEIKGEKGDIVSILPFGGDLLGVSTEGLEYPLKNETLFFGKGRGVSNVMTGDFCRITVGSGIGLITKSTD